MTAGGDDYQIWPPIRKPPGSTYETLKRVGQVRQLISQFCHMMIVNSGIMNPYKFIILFLPLIIYYVSKL